MASATLNLKVIQRRMLPVREAADYCGISPKRFPVECGVTPVSMPGGARLYDMRDLDAWLDSLKSGDSTGDDDIVGRLG